MSLPRIGRIQTKNVNLDNIAKSDPSLYIQAYHLSDEKNYILWDMVTLENTYYFGNT